MGVEESDFIKYFSKKSKYNIPQEECIELAEHFRFKIDKRSASMAKLKRIKTVAYFVNWDKFSERIENMNELSTKMK